MQEPALTSAGSCYYGAMDALKAFVGKVQAEILDPLITLVALAAFIIFAWGLVDFIRGAADPTQRKTGQQHMLWGIVGLVIIFGAQVILRILKNLVGVE